MIVPYIIEICDEFEKFTVPYLNLENFFEKSKEI